MTAVVGAGSALPVAPHVWFVLLGSAALASAACVLAARRGLSAGAALVAASIALAGVAVLVGAELVAMGLVILGGVSGLGIVLASAPHGRPRPTAEFPPARSGPPRRLLVAAVAGTSFAALTAAAGIAAVGAGRVSSTAPTTAAVLARPLYTGGALLVDGTALVLLLTLVASRARSVEAAEAPAPC